MKTIKILINQWLSKIILGLAIIVFSVYFSSLSITRLNTLNSYYYDLGIMDQVVYNTSQGRILEMTNPTYLKNMNRLAIHFDPILALLSPLYKLYNSPVTLLISQVIIVGLGALAVFLISNQVLKNQWISLLFSLSYLFYFPVERAVIFDFHSVTLATTFLLFAFYFDLIKKYFWFYLFIGLSLLTKEHIGLMILMVGLYQYFIGKKKKIGLITSIIGLLFFVITVYVIIPFFRGDTHFATSYFNDATSRINAIVIDGYKYSKMLIIPTFFSLLSPLSLIIALPEWAINIVSSNSNMRSILFHYNSVIVAVIYYSLILGFNNFQQLVKKNKILIYGGLILFVALNIRSGYNYNPVPINIVKHPVIYQPITMIKDRSIKYWQEKLKDDNIKVCTTPKLAPFFTHRQYYYNFLYDSAYVEMGLTENDIIRDKINKYKLADYIIINRSEIGDIDKDGLPVKFYFQLIDDPNYQMIYTDDQAGDSIEVYQNIKNKN